jgi:Tat protein secretion system quality control protein TatD with DNase activity
MNANATFRTEEYEITTEDRLVIEWDAEVRTIRTFTRGTADPLYVGDSLDRAAESLEIDRATLDERLMSDPVIRDQDGQIVDE